MNIRKLMLGLFLEASGASMIGPLNSPRLVLTQENEDESRSCSMENGRRGFPANSPKSALLVCPNRVQRDAGSDSSWVIDSGCAGWG